MIGNDLVDRRQALIDSNWRRPRYLQKVFTPQERTWIAQADEPELLVWLLWSCKEAAYKEWAGRHGRRVFAPQKIMIVQQQTTAQDHYRSELVIGTETYHVNSQVEPEYLHSWTIQEQAAGGVQQVIPTEGAPAGLAIRSAVKRYLSQRFAWSMAAIDIEKAASGRPVVYYEKERVAVSLSLSHHGGYAGFVVGGKINRT